MLFGVAKQWSDWIGELSTVSLVKQADSVLSQEALTAVLRFKQVQRELCCSAHLAQVLDRNTGKPHSYQDYLRSSILPELQPGGSMVSGALLHVVGSIYVEQARQASATNVATAAIAGLSESLHGYKSQCDAIRAAIKLPAAIAQSELQPAEILRAGVEALFASTVLDVEWTTRCVCWNVLNDRGAGVETKARRILAMQMLGEEFLMHGCTKRQGVETIFERVVEFI